MREVMAVLLLMLPGYVTRDPGALFCRAAAAADAALETIAEAERAFVRAAADEGIVPAFVRFFAEDAIGFEGEEVVPAREQWRQQAPVPASLKLRWEPRLGDIAASGDIGWLTGPVERTGVPGRGAETLYSCYFSIWRRQDDGAYKVVLDTGVRTPSRPAFPEGLTRPPHASRYTGAARGDTARATLVAADRALTERTRTTPLAEAYRPCLTAASRFHRNNALPIAGREAILQWLVTQPALDRSAVRDGIASAAGDLGYTYGTYAIVGDAPEHGWYLRVWTREADGSWKLTVDITQPQ